MEYIQYPQCTTCKKAEAFLKENNVAFTKRNIETENPSYDELKAWYEKSGLPLKKFFNTCGVRYKELNLKEALKDMPEEQQLKLLASDGLLVKRPILLTSSQVLVGFKQEQWENIIK